MLKDKLRCQLSDEQYHFPLPYTAMEVKETAFDPNSSFKTNRKYKVSATFYCEQYVSADASASEMAQARDVALNQLNRLVFREVSEEIKAVIFKTSLGSFSKSEVMGDLVKILNKINEGTCYGG